MKEESINAPLANQESEEMDYMEYEITVPSRHHLLYDYQENKEWSQCIERSAK